MTSTAPLPQPLQALAKANEVRVRHAAFRRHVAAMTSEKGAAYVAVALSEGLEQIQDATVEYVICAVRGYREQRAVRLLRSAGVTRRWTRRTTATDAQRLLRVHELTERESLAIAAALIAPGGEETNG